MNALIIAKQMTILFIIVLVGYFLRKRQIVSDENGSFLSAMIVNVFNPCLIISSALSQICTDPAMVYKTFLFAALSFLLLILLGKVYQKLFSKDSTIRNIYQLCFVFSNVGFIGIPLVNAAFGSEALIYLSIFILEYNILIYTYGLRLVAAKNSSGALLETLKSLINPGVISCIFALVFFLLQIQLPEILSTPITYLGNCATPLSLLTIGISIGSEKNLLTLFTQKKHYLFCFLKLIVTPFIGILVFKHLPHIPTLIAELTIITLGMPVGSMTLMLVQKNGHNPATCSSTIILSTIFSIFTLPVVAFLYHVIP